MTRAILAAILSILLASPVSAQPYQAVTVTGEQPRDVEVSVQFSLAPTMPAAPSTRMDLTIAAPAGLVLYANGVRLTAAPPVPPASAATLAASPPAIARGGSSVLTLFTPGEYHNVSINGMRPVGVTVGTATTWTLAVAPLVTTTYITSMTNRLGTAWPVLSTTVTVGP